MARQYGRYGYRKIAGLLDQAGWLVNDKRVERIWRREGLKVPAKQSKQGRIWLADGSCIRLRAERPNHVWSYDFVQDRTEDGRTFRMLCVIDEFTRRCLAIVVARRNWVVGALTVAITGLTTIVFATILTQIKGQFWSMVPLVTRNALLVAPSLPATAGRSLRSVAGISRPFGSRSASSRPGSKNRTFIFTCPKVRRPKTDQARAWP